MLVHCYAWDKRKLSVAHLVKFFIFDKIFIFYNWLFLSTTSLINNFINLKIKSVLTFLTLLVIKYVCVFIQVLMRVFTYLHLHQLTKSKFLKEEYIYLFFSKKCIHIESKNKCRTLFCSDSSSITKRASHFADFLYVERSMRVIWYISRKGHKNTLILA